jgi:hypothetical protein
MAWAGKYFLFDFQSKATGALSRVLTCVSYRLEERVELYPYSPYTFSWRAHRQIFLLMPVAKFGNI